MVGVRPKLQNIIEYSRERDQAMIDGEGGPGAERSFLLADDREACRVAAAWPCMEPTWKRPSFTLTVDRGSTWKRRPKRAMLWAWAGVEVDFEALAAAAGVPRARTMARFIMLRDNLLIYPDGTLSPIATRIVARVTIQKIG